MRHGQIDESTFQDLLWKASYGCSSRSLIGVQELEVGDSIYIVLQDFRSPFGVLYIENHEIDIALELLFY